MGEVEQQGVEEHEGSFEDVEVGFVDVDGAGEAGAVFGDAVDAAGCYQEGGGVESVEEAGYALASVFGMFVFVLVRTDIGVVVALPSFCFIDGGEGVAAKQPSSPTASMKHDRDRHEPDECNRLQYQRDLHQYRAGRGETSVLWVADADQTGAGADQAFDDEVNADEGRDDAARV